MRVSTSWMYSSGAQAITRKQSELLQTQQQLSSGKRVMVPSDDPIAAANALTTQQSLALAQQYGQNQDVAKGTLGLAESTLAQVGEALQDIRVLAISAGNGSLSAGDRGSLAIELRGKIDALLGLANTRDGARGYLFSGYQEGIQPFARTTAGTVYQGDQGSRAVQVAAQRTMEVSASGASIFEGAHAGNGRFTVAAAALNTGSGMADAGAVTDQAALTGRAYQVVFRVLGGVTTYDVVDTAAGTNVTTGAAYKAGGAIGFAGMQFAVSGAPANGDVFSVAPSTRQSVFKTLDDLATALESSASRALKDGAFQTALTAGIASLDQASDQVLSVRTGLGARLRELDSLGSQAADQKLHYQEELSRLTDLDYAAAISSLTQQQTSLQAAQQSYLRITGLSLFNYL